MIRVHVHSIHGGPTSPHVCSLPGCSAHFVFTCISSKIHVLCTCIIHAGMSIEDVREYERKLHDETNQKVLDGLEIPDSKPDT